MKRLRMETIYCDTCGHRLVIDCKLDGIIYCTCSTNNTCAAKAAYSKATMSNKQCESYEKEWQPYMERRNMVIWRREAEPGLFAYKGDLNPLYCFKYLLMFLRCPFSVYAIYDDISAEEFLHVQTDTEYRKIWDKTAISLDIVDIDPVHRHKSHIIYWEMQWPVR